VKDRIMVQLTEPCIATDENIRFCRGVLSDLLAGGISASLQFDEAGYISVWRDRKGYVEVASDGDVYHAINTHKIVNSKEAA